MSIYIMCQHCAEPIKVEEDTIIDSGATFLCSSCNQPTVVDLFKVEERAKLYGFHGSIR